MDWDRLDQQIPSSVSDRDRQTIRQVTQEAIINSHHDPEIVLDTVADALTRADQVSNLRAYISSAITRTLKRITLAQLRRDQLAAEGLRPLPKFADEDSIENAILVREMLESLSPSDHEIFSRRLEGEEFPEIDAAMALKRRTAESRFRICSEAIRQSIAKKAGCGKLWRGR
jgi:hypothetical protein